jgi:hypothetical protein
MGTNPWRAPKTEAQRGVAFRRVSHAQEAANLAGENEEVPALRHGRPYRIARSRDLATAQPAHRRHRTGGVTFLQHLQIAEGSLVERFCRSLNE